MEHFIAKSQSFKSICPVDDEDDDDDDGCS